MTYHYAPVDRDGVVRDFTVPVMVDGPEDDCTEWIRVVVYETQLAMLQAAHDFNGVQDPDEDPEDAPWGITQAWNGLGPMPDDEPRAIVRLCLPALLKTVVLHELVHATQVVYAWGRLPGVDYNPWGIANEDYAYMLQHTWEMVDEHMRWNTSLHPDGPDAHGQDVFARITE